MKRLHKLIAGMGFVVLISAANLGAQALPDLWLSTEKAATCDITFSRVIPKAKEKVEVRANIHNKGESDAVNVKVNFFSGDPEKGGKQIGEPQTIDNISPNEKKKVKVEWTPPQNGFHHIFVVIDPDNKITEKDRKNNIASLDVPIVAKDLYFGIWPVEDNPELAKSLKYVNSILFQGGDKLIKTKEDREYWENRGIRICSAKPGYCNSRKWTEEQFVESWSSPKDGINSIYIDEFGCDWGGPLDVKLSNALKKTKKEHPELFIITCQAGPLNQIICDGYREGADLVLLELYAEHFRTAFETHSFYQYLEKRINDVRNWDILVYQGKRVRSVVMVGVGTHAGGMPFDEIENQVRYIKRKGPEMPGITFFGRPLKLYSFPEYGLKIYYACDHFCYKYYILPVVTIREEDIFFSNYHPNAREEVTITAAVQNVGGMDAKDITVNFILLPF